MCVLHNILIAPFIIAAFLCCWCIYREVHFRHNDLLSLNEKKKIQCNNRKYKHYLDQHMTLCTCFASKSITIKEFAQLF